MRIRLISEIVLDHTSFLSGTRHDGRWCVPSRHLALTLVFPLFFREALFFHFPRLFFLDMRRTGAAAFLGAATTGSGSAGSCEKGASKSESDEEAGAAAQKDVPPKTGTARPQARAAPRRVPSPRIGGALCCPCGLVSGGSFENRRRQQLKRATTARLRGAGAPRGLSQPLARRGCHADGATSQKARRSPCIAPSSRPQPAFLPPCAERPAAAASASGAGGGGCGGGGSRG